MVKIYHFDVYKSEKGFRCDKENDKYDIIF